MLSDREQRALDELERRYATEAAEPVRADRSARPSARRSSRPPGFRVVLALSCVSVALLVAGVPVAALAWAVATAIGWTCWRLWPQRAGERAPAPSGTAGHGHEGRDRRPGESIRQYLRWLAEAE